MSQSANWILLNAKLAALSGETSQGADALEGVSVIEKTRDDDLS